MNLKDDTSDAVVGWAIVNTTGSGNLQVQVHTNSAAPGTWDVYVRIAGLNAPGPAIPDGPITVDAEGEGNAHFVIDISSLFGPTARFLEGLARDKGNARLGTAPPRITYALKIQEGQIPKVSLEATNPIQTIFAFDFLS